MLAIASRIQILRHGDLGARRRRSMPPVGRPGITPATLEKGKLNRAAGQSHMRVSTVRDGRKCDDTFAFAVRIVCDSTNVNRT
jgi:hypothetical protein